LAGKDAAAQETVLAFLCLALKPFLPRTCAFIRIDPPWHSTGADAAAPLLEKPFRRAAADVQPPDTVIIDLSKTVEDLLAGMKSKWRYNVRLAEKKGVTIRSAGAEGLPVFYRLFEETCRRDGIAMHSLDYYQTLFRLAADDPTVDARLYIATGGAASEAAGDLAAIITLFRGGEATYLYGASASEGRNLMPTYLLQWQAICDAKAAGCRSYDLFGIPPTAEEGHPMHGLYQFKTGFGGAIIHRPGSWDYDLRPLPARLFRAAEKARKRMRDRKKT
jgi:lipid II:glycine glycyltransferase (peptidoglycan interpeptide bridge formation enzyme)